MTSVPSRFPLSFRLIAVTVAIAFLTGLPAPYVLAQTVFQMPTPGVRIGLSPTFTPPLIRGITIHPENPLRFDFIMTQGDKPLPQNAKEAEYERLIKYFLAALTVPEKDLWVNLSPYEKDRITSESFGKTEMGRDLLAQDYLLKQITASLIYPEDDLGKAFWDKVYKEAQEKFHTTEIPVNTFNKVWIVPDEATVYEHGNSAFVVYSHLKVMLEEDYLALEKSVVSRQESVAKPQLTTDLRTTDSKDVNKLGSQIVREIILPALEKEVNEGKNFAMLRQVFQSVVLAVWYKKALKESLLGQVYADQNKVKGVDQKDTAANQEIYDKYVEAFKKGVFNYIKEDYDAQTDETIPRKYFSGGATTLMPNLGPAKDELRERMNTATDLAALSSQAAAVVGQIQSEVAQGDADQATVRLGEVKGNAVEPVPASDTTTDGRENIGSAFAPKPESLPADAAALSMEEGQLLASAEGQINSLLDEQYASRAITEIIYQQSKENVIKSFQFWTSDEETYRLSPSVRRANLEAIRSERWKEIVEAYRQDIAFGTAGIRGKAALTQAELLKLKQEGPGAVILKGPNMINDIVLLQKTAGVIQYARETGKKRIVLGYDSRVAGPEFADMIARQFLAASTPEHEFELFMFDEASPFPELSFGITTPRVKGDIGIFLSASHNPADYNGYKITLGNGAQLDQKNKDLVLAAVKKVTLASVNLADSIASAKPGQITWLGGAEKLPGKEYYDFPLLDIHTDHVNQVKSFLLDKEVIAQHGKDVVIGFAAFNGAGYKAVPRLLRETGFSNFKVISSLQELDGLFPAFQYGEQPDPGDPISADIAVREFIKEHDQEEFDKLDILIGTDPDSDRMGLIVKVPENQQKEFGKYRLLSANDAWTLLTWYRLMKKKELGQLENPDNHVVAMSHATSDAIEAAAGLFGVKAVGQMMDKTGTQDRGNYLSGRRTWVGFAHLGAVFEEMERQGKITEIGAEESNGVSIQGHVKDKDGTLAAILMAEIAAYAKSRNTTIFELLDDIYMLTGHYATANKPLPRTGAFEGAAGVSEKIKILQETQRWAREANERAQAGGPLFTIGGREVIGAVEFKSGRIDSNHYEGVPDEGVRFFFKDGDINSHENFTQSRNYIMIRPSGTAQTLRFYTQIYSSVDRDHVAQQKFVNFTEAERVALLAQRQILSDVDFGQKYFAMVDTQLDAIPDAAALADDAQSITALQELISQGKFTLHQHINTVSDLVVSGAIKEDKIYLPGAVEKAFQNLGRIHKIFHSITGEELTKDEVLEIMSTMPAARLFEFIYPSGDKVNMVLVVADTEAQNRAFVVPALIREGKLTANANPEILNDERIAKSMRGTVTSYAFLSGDAEAADRLAAIAPDRITVTDNQGRIIPQKNWSGLSLTKGHWIEYSDQSVLFISMSDAAMTIAEAAIDHNLEISEELALIKSIRMQPVLSTKGWHPKPMQPEQYHNFVKTLVGERKFNPKIYSDSEFNIGQTRLYAGWSRDHQQGVFSINSSEGRFHLGFIMKSAVDGKPYTTITNKNNQTVGLEGYHFITMGSKGRVVVAVIDDQYYDFLQTQGFDNFWGTTADNVGWIVLSQTQAAQHYDALKDVFAWERDAAMAAEVVNNQPTAPGGIDITKIESKLQIKRDANGVPLSLEFQDVANINIDGFVPHIINITPVTNLNLLMGMEGGSSQPKTAAVYEMPVLGLAREV